MLINAGWCFDMQTSFATEISRSAVVISAESNIMSRVKQENIRQHFIANYTQLKIEKSFEFTLTIGMLNSQASGCTPL